MNGRDLALEKGQHLIDFVKLNGKPPSYRSPNKTETKLHTWWGRTARALKGRGDGIWWNELEEQATKAGLPSLYVINPLPPVSDTGLELINFIKLNNRHPSRHSSDKGEIKLHVWWDHMKQAIKGNGSHVWHSELHDQAVTAGMPKLYITQTPDDKFRIATERGQQVISFVEFNKKTPSRYSPNKTEAKMGRWLSNMKQAAKGKGAYTWYPELKEQATAANMPNLYTTRVK